MFITGIGCAGRFAYYMDTYGMHGIHGRAPALATGLASTRDDLSIWVVTGDGDALSIGGNHLIHALRRNVPIKVLLFNNQIYGLTKGQASPTSELGKITKSTPFGVSDHPFNPVALALGAEATFVARTIDRDRQHLTDVLRAAAQHEGAALVEIYQNCPVFNDGAFAALTEKDVKDANQIRLEAGQADQVRRGRRARRRDAARTARSRSSTSAEVAEEALVVHDPATERRGPGLLARPAGRRSYRPDADRHLPRREPSGVRARARPPARAAPRRRSSASSCLPATPGRSAEHLAAHRREAGWKQRSLHNSGVGRRTLLARRGAAGSRSAAASRPWLPNGNIGPV